MQWVVWNLALAFIPALLAWPLFRRGARPGLGWWLLLLVFLAFLPNAPYVLTDVIHLPGELAAAPPGGAAAVYLKYLMLFVLGFACYAISVVRLQRWLRARGWPVLAVAATAVVLHAVCAVGVFLGRVLRLNSWDLVFRPQLVLGAFSVPEPATARFLVVAFGIFAAGTLAAQVFLEVSEWVLGRRRAR